MTIAAQYGWTLEGFDVKTAFLQGNLVLKSRSNERFGSGHRPMFGATFELLDSVTLLTSIKAMLVVNFHQGVLALTFLQAANLVIALGMPFVSVIVIWAIPLLVTLRDSLGLVAPKQK